MTGNPIWDTLLGGVIYLASLIVGIVAHEGGHLIVAQLLGLQPRCVIIGTGSTLLRRRVGRVWLIIRAAPFSGVVLMPIIVGRPLARTAFYAAGPAVTLGLLGLCAVAGLTGRSFGAEAAIIAGAAQAVTLLKVLWPRRLTIDGEIRPSDGLQLLRILTGRVPDVLGPMHAALLTPLLAPGAPLPRPSRHMPEIILQATRPDRYREAWAARDAQDAMRGLLAAPDLPTMEHAFVLTFLVGNELYFGPTGSSRRELDEWSADALARAPAPHTRVLRGGVLVAIGQPAAARALILPARAAELIEYDQILSRAFLGQAEAALGAVDEARRLFVEARAQPWARVGFMGLVLDRLERAATPQTTIPGKPSCRS